MVTPRQFEQVHDIKQMNSAVHYTYCFNRATADDTLRQVSEKEKEKHCEEKTYLWLNELCTISFHT